MSRVIGKVSPIDPVADNLLRMIEKQALLLLREMEAGGGDPELRADYEALRRLAGSLTVERRSPLPPVPSAA